jgi:hypothetical protein
MNFKTLKGRAKEAFETVVVSTQTGRAINGMAYEELPDSHNLARGYGHHVEALKYDDPNFMAHTLAGWASGYKIGEMAELLDVDERRIAEIWHSAGLKERSAQEDLVGERINQLENHVSHGGEELSVTLGTTPSGIPSIANLYTFAKGVKTVKEIADAHGKRTDFLFGVNDHLVPSGEHELLKRNRAIYEAISRISEELGVEISPSYFSEMQRTAPFRSLLQKAADRLMFADSEATGLTLFERPEGMREYTPLDEDDANSRTDYEDSRSDFASKLGTTVLLRNAVANSNIHILGGDASHALKLANKAAQLDVASPLVYTTGIMYGPDGEEMHAGSENTFKLEDLRSPDTWVEDLAALKPRPSGDLGVLEYGKLLTPEATKRIYQPSSRFNPIQMVMALIGGRR